MHTKAIVIGAGADAIHTINAARELGIYVAAMDGNPAAAGLQYADEAINIDISDIDILCEEVARIKPDFILPVPVGRMLRMIGIINEHFGLPGIKSNAAEVSTDKYLFHKILNKAGLRSICCHLIARQEPIRALDIPFPAIMKPRFGSGSRGIYLVKDSCDLDVALKKVQLSLEDYVLEELVAGNEYSLDGAVLNGNLEITLLRKKIITPFPARQPVASIALSRQANKELYDRVYCFVSKAAEELGYDNCLLNVDMILDDENVFIIEMAPRPSGHSIHSVFVPLCTKIDMAKEYINYMMNKSYRMTPTDIQCQMIRFFDFSDVIADKIPNRDDIVAACNCNLVDWNCRIKEGDYLQPVTDGKSLMWRGYFIIQGKNEQELKEQSEQILSVFKFR